MRNLFSKPNEEQLLADIQTGGEKSLNRAMASVYRWKDEFIGFAKKNGCPLQDAEDIFQFAVVAFWKQVSGGKFQGESSLKTYLFSIAKNMMFKTLKRANPELLEAADAEAEGFSGFDIVRIKEIRNRVAKGFAGLGERCKEILDKTALGWKAAEIAAYAGYKKTTVIKKRSQCLSEAKVKIGYNNELKNEVTWMLNN